jgi:hypothetical protein
MKSVIIASCFLLTHLVSYCQTNDIDSLIARLDNEKLFGTCNYVWVLKNGSKEADTLISIGKTQIIDKSDLYKKLYYLLTDTTRGIISHYILTNIFYQDHITSGSIYFDKDSTLEYNYSGLRFYENNYRRMFTDKSELEHNQKVWAVLFRQLKLID